MRFASFTSKKTGLPIQVNLDNVTAIAARANDKSSVIFVVGSEEGLTVKEGLAYVVAETTRP